MKKRYRELLAVFDLKYKSDRIKQYPKHQTALNAMRTYSYASTNGIGLEYDLSTPHFKRKWKAFYLEFLIVSEK